MRRIALAASVAAGLVVIAGCASDPVEPADARSYYFDQEIEWEDCDSGAECATVLAPLNWDDLDALHDRCVAVTPLQFDLTRYPRMEDMARRKWSLGSGHE